MHTETLPLRRSVNEILDYRNPPVVNQYLKEHGGNAEDAERCFHTLKQFLAACSVTEGDRVASKTVDNMWHTFILFTRDYKGFCEDYLGRFVHHIPSERLSVCSSTATRAVAESLFGYVFEDFWPRQGLTGNCESSSCDCCPVIDSVVT